MDFPCLSLLTEEDVEWEHAVGEANREDVREEET